MPEIRPGDAPSPRAALGTDLTHYYVLRVDANGRLQIDVLSNAGLDDALQSVATDRLIVRGEDQLFSFKETLISRTEGIVSGAGGYLDSTTPPDGEVWHVTVIRCSDRTSPTTSHSHALRDGVDSAGFYTETAAFAAKAPSTWSHRLWLEHDDLIRVTFNGSLIGDTCRIDMIGYRMTKET